MELALLPQMFVVQVLFIPAVFSQCGSDSSRPTLMDRSSFTLIRFLFMQRK